jgi:hypothetical protein
MLLSSHERNKAKKKQKIDINRLIAKVGCDRADLGEANNLFYQRTESEKARDLRAYCKITNSEG